MFTIELLPAAEGDCLWIEFGDPARPQRILIDTGTAGTYKALARRIHDLPPDQRRTHIDSDHIGAASHLLNKRSFGVEFGDVWFNGHRHLQQAADRLGAAQGESLSRALDEQKVPWNHAFGGKPVMAAAAELPMRKIGDMCLTVLSPYPEQLRALLPTWDTHLRALRAKQGEAAEAQPADRLGALVDVRALAESEFIEDDKAPNGSSIALLAEFDGKRVLLGADAFPSVIERSIDKLLAPAGASRLELDAFKVCHHGSTRNTSPALARKLAARSLLVSSSGNRHEHPNAASIARLLYYGDGQAIRLLFNYRTDFNRAWRNPLLGTRHRYRVEYPADNAFGIVWGTSPIERSVH